MDGDSILFLHFVELVDAANASIGKNKSSSFENEFVGDWIFLDDSSQADTG